MLHICFEYGSMLNLDIACMFTSDECVSTAVAGMQVYVVKVSMPGWTVSIHSSMHSLISTHMSHQLTTATPSWELSGPAHINNISSSNRTMAAVRVPMMTMRRLKHVAGNRGMTAWLW